MKLKAPDSALVIVGLLVLAVIVFVVILTVQIRQDPVAEQVEANKMVPVLFNLTENGQIRLSQVLLVETSQRRLAQFDVPYNLGMILSDLGRVDRISVLYEEQGVQTYQNRVSNFFNLDIPFRLELDMDAFGKVTDLLGGIPLFVQDAVDIHQEDTVIRIPSGNVVLDGAKIEDFIRLLQVGEGAQERTDRGFDAVRGFLSRIESSLPILRTDRGQNLLQRLIRTNLGPDNLLPLLELFVGLNYENVMTQRVLGVERTVQTPEGEIPLLFPHFEGQLARDSVRQVAATLSLEGGGEIPIAEISVEILNGTRVNGLARRTNDLLVNYGLQVLRYGNAEEQDVERTQVIYHTSIHAAEQVAGLIRAETIIPGTSGGVDGPDVTVILGRDFDGWYVRAE